MQGFAKKSLKSVPSLCAGCGGTLGGYIPNLRPLTSKLAQRRAYKNWAPPLHKVKNESCQNSMKLGIQVHIGSRTSHKKFERHRSTDAAAPVNLILGLGLLEENRPALPDLLEVVRRR